MSNKAKAMCYIAVMAVSLSVIASLYILMPECENCGRKFCFGSCTITYENSGQDPQSLRPNQPKTNQTTTRLTETERVDAESYFDDVYFIGDSRTRALQLYGVPLDHIFAEDGLNHERALTAECVRMSEQKLMTIPDAVSVTIPKIMIINFGINGAYFWSVEDFMEKYAVLIDALLEKSPNSIVVIEAILPVSLGYEYSDEGVSNAKIDELNMALYQYAQENGFYYLATNEVLKDENNALKDEYTGDGLHLNDLGYEKVLDYILTHAILTE